MTIEVVRGALGEPVASDVVGFWVGRGVLAEDAARARLAEVVCVVRDDGGAIVGVSSAFAAEIAIIGNRRFWRYRRFAPGLSRPLDDDLLVATFDALAPEHEPGGPSPIGVCVVVDPETGPALGREAVLPTGFLHAGYEAGGHQVRIRYFDGAQIAV